MVVALTPAEGPAWVAVAVLSSAQVLYGFSLGLEDPNEMGYWQAFTPREMLGRVNATRRSANRTAAVLGALLGGVLAGSLDYRETLGVAVVVFLAAVLIAGFSPVRRARVDVTTEA